MNLRTFNLPDLGEGLTEAEIIRWLVSPGDVIIDDEPVVEVETAKATVEVPAPYAGAVTELHGEQGGFVQVGSPLITVEVGAVRADEQASPALEEPAAQAYVEEERAGSGNVLVGYGTGAGSGSAARAGRRRSRSSRTAQHRPAAAAPPPPPPAPDIDQPDDERPKSLVSSPVVRQLARDHGVDLSRLSGSGAGGVITRKDVEAAIAKTTEAEEAGAEDKAAATVPSPSAAPDHGPAVARRVPIKGTRKVIADRLSQSRREIPEATAWVDVDATALMALRADIARDTGEKAPGVAAFVARFVTAGLSRFPALNSSIDTEHDEIVEYAGVGLGIAVQTDRGLTVPVVHDAHRLTMRSLDAEIRRMSAAALEGRASPSDLSGGTFTLNNYGSFGIDGSAAIVNFPEAAILGVGRTLERPWVVDSEIVARMITQLSLVFDHRVTDGGTAAGFLRFVADCIERPTAALTEV